MVLHIVGGVDAALRHAARQERDRQRHCPRHRRPEDEQVEEELSRSHDCRQQIRRRCFEVSRVGRRFHAQMNTRANFMFYCFTCTGGCISYAQIFISFEDWEESNNCPDGLLYVLPADCT